MALTKYEALDRAAAIWGGDNWKIERCNDWGMLIRSADHCHKLDANGHPICHKTCKELEAIAYQRKLLK
jgi:hypothetical protein